MESSNGQNSDGAAATALVIPSVEQLVEKHGTKALRACVARPELGLLAFGAMVAYKRIPAVQRGVRVVLGGLLGGGK